MLTTGFALAVITSTGFYVIYTKLPSWIKGWMLKHSLITDVVACVFTYALFGGTVTALFAAAFVGLFVSMLLALLNNQITAEAIENLGERFKALQAKFAEYIAAMIKHNQGEEKEAA
jgi:hypothetical protein